MMKLRCFLIIVVALVDMQTSLQATDLAVGTLYRLQIVGAAVDVYNEKMGKLPNNDGGSSWLHKVISFIGEEADEFGISSSWLFSSKAGEPGGFSEEVVLVDGWGNNVVYQISGSRYALYSCGRNGVDDHGDGDDIVRGRGLDWWYYKLWMRYCVSLFVGLMSVAAIGWFVSKYLGHGRRSKEVIRRPESNT